MKMTIITQENEFVNYDNVVSIYPTELEAEDIESKENITVFGLVAQTVTGDIQLGIFENFSTLSNVADELEKWLAKGNYPIYHIPAEDESGELNGI